MPKNCFIISSSINGSTKYFALVYTNTGQYQSTIDCWESNVSNAMIAEVGVFKKNKKKCVYF